MGRSVRKIWVGLDWGTHSSKWWLTAEDSTGTIRESKNVPSVVDSTIHKSGQDVRLVRERARIKSEIQDARLKRLLLQDPQGASFWDAPREGIGLSLGDAATLSLAVLLGDIAAYFEASNLVVEGGETALRIRYSLPNWISSDAKHRAARRRMYETAAVVGGLLAQEGVTSMPRVGAEVRVDRWHERVSGVRNAPTCQQILEQSPVDFKSLAEDDCSFPSRPDIRWRFSAESSAAGFPQLQHLLIPPEKARRTQDHWVKLLVVDVGAGSTDAGYFISSRRANGRLILNYLRPAPTLDYAGEQLTEMLRRFYLRKKNREMTIQEAETLKVSAADQWKNEDFANAWKEEIASFVGDYMYEVPDHRRLGEPAIPGLKIVLTGGSGLVEGLDRSVRNAVVDALVRRGVPGNVANRTEISELALDWPEDPIDRARRAVSIGAGTRSFASLKYLEEFDRAAPAPGPLERW